MQKQALKWYFISFGIIIGASMFFTHPATWKEALIIILIPIAFWDIVESLVKAEQAAKPFTREYMNEPTPPPPPPTQPNSPPLLTDTVKISWRYFLNVYDEAQKVTPVTEREMKELAIVEMTEILIQNLKVYKSAPRPDDPNELYDFVLEIVKPRKPGTGK